MVLRNKIRILSGVVLFLILTFSFSCEKTFPGMILCSDCYDDEPLVTSLEIKLANNYYKSIHIDIFEGNLEDSVLYRTIESSASVAKVTVLINKKYTLVATYFIPVDYFLVVNSVTPYAVYDDVQCEKPCYLVKDNVVDLRLKRIK